MRAARPLDGGRAGPALDRLDPASSSGRGDVASASFTGVPDATQPPYRNVGRIFIRVGRFDGFCSGTAINSASRQLVLTAGHCLYDILPHHRRPSLTRFLDFVPAYTNGTAPFGEFVGHDAYLLRPWVRKLNEHFDVGAVLAGPNAAGQNVADAVGGGAAIALGQPRRQQYQLLGYPGFNQQQMQQCIGSFAGSIRLSPKWGGPASMGVDCFMGRGASGGPWLIGGGTAVAGMSTFGIRRDFRHTLGPYFAQRNVGRLVAGL
jgi:V8-like Glu-specific endopeptidase